jgi:hypothetical protein
MANTSRPLSAYSPDTCMFCHQSLRITTGANTGSESEHPLERGEATTVIDDVEVYCGPPGSGPGGHHAHWTCLIDHAMQARIRSVVPAPPVPIPGGASASASTFATCVVCGQNVLGPDGRFVVDVRNEGGETKGFDFGVIIVRSRRLSFPSLPPSSARGRGTVLIRIGHTLQCHRRRCTLTWTRT